MSVKTERLIISVFLFFCIILYPLSDCLIKEETPSLRISGNGRYFITENGKPFFWLGDTGWLLLKKLSREDIKKYFKIRKKQGFNVIQIMIIHDLKRPVNFYGDSAFTGKDISKPLVTPGNSFENSDEYDFWDHLDFVVNSADKYGIYLALVPIWGSNVKKGMVNLKQIERYASFLASRYGMKNNIIWLNGGDVLGSDSTSIWNTLGKILHEKCKNQLISFHPFGRTSSSLWFHNENWLDFNMFQSGHKRYDQDTSGLQFGEDNWKYVFMDYNKQPAKPTLDGEPSYEDIPQGLHDTTQPRWTARDVRRYAYWSVLAGACGFTYGHNSVMQFYRPGDSHKAYGVRAYWFDVLNSDGARQMKYFRKLMEKYLYFKLVPDTNLVCGNRGQKYEYIASARNEKYALFYIYTGRKFCINAKLLPGKKLRLLWYNPENGSKTHSSIIERKSSLTITPPVEGRDWLLVVEFLN